MADVPDPKLVAQVLDAPVSVRLSSVAAKKNLKGETVAFFLVMSDADGKVLAKHAIPDFQAATMISYSLVRDFAKCWPEQASQSELGRKLVDQ